MKKAIVYGAGNIGRGFLGQLLFESDYEIVFIDANKDLVNLLQREKKYPIRIVNNEGYTEVNVEHIKAIHSSETAMIIDEIATADIIFTSVGANILSIIAGPIAAGLCRRWDNGNMNPINLVLCENLFDADKKMEAYVKNAINRLCTSMGYTELIDNLVGFVIASIGRMVPVMSKELLDENPLLINVEAYKKLPVNSAAIKGEVPKINNLVPYAPFGYYIERKLYIHNMGHAMTAYLGYLNHKTYIWEVLEDEEIAIIVKDAMLASAKALSLKNQVSYEELSEHVDDLLQRFGNWALGDTVARVGRDLGRKLLPNDRMIGALNLCSEMGVNCDGLILGIAAALLFDDTIESDLNKLLKKGDYRKVLVDFCNIKPKDQLFSLIVLAYEKLHKKLDL